MNDIVIALENVTKSYSKKNAPAVQGFSMQCRRGTVTGLLGLNGAGKTTVLKAVCARHFATSGAVTICGVDAAAEPEAVRMLTGFVSEQSVLPGEYSVSEYLFMRSALFGLSGSAQKAAVERVTAQCALDDVTKQKIRSLSKGFLERVNFAQALVHNPPVLVLDEPASGLDPAQIVRMRALVKQLLPEHTVLLSTHLMQEVDALCDTVYILHKGSCVAHGTALEIVAATHTSSLEEAFFALTGSKESL